MLSCDRDYSGFAPLTFAPILALFAKQNRAEHVDLSLAFHDQTQGHNQGSFFFLVAASSQRLPIITPQVLENPEQNLF